MVRIGHRGKCISHQKTSPHYACMRLNITKTHIKITAKTVGVIKDTTEENGGEEKRLFMSNQRRTYEDRTAVDRDMQKNKKIKRTVCF